MRKAEQANIIKVIKGYCDIDQTPEQLAQNMGTDGVSYVEGGGLAIYNVDMFEELMQVYGETFKPEVYLKPVPAHRLNGSDIVLDGISYDFKYKNGMPYVFTVYCQKFGQVLNNLKAEA